MIKQTYEILAHENNRGLSCYLIITILKKKEIINRLEI